MSTRVHRQIRTWGQYKYIAFLSLIKVSRVVASVVISIFIDLLSLYAHVNARIPACAFHAPVAARIPTICVWYDGLVSPLS